MINIFKIGYSNFSNSVSSSHSSGGISGKKTPKFSFSFVRRKPACLRHRSSLSGCRFGRSGSSGFVVDFRRLRLSNRGLALKVRRSLGRCRYRCSCLCRCIPAIGGCRPRRSGCVSDRYSSRRVCLGVLSRGGVRTGRRRMSRFRCCRLAF